MHLWVHYAERVLLVLSALGGARAKNKRVAPLTKHNTLRLLHFVFLESGAPKFQHCIFPPNSKNRFRPRFPIIEHAAFSVPARFFPVPRRDEFSAVIAAMT
jgi:hypothetical protein